MKTRNQQTWSVDRVHIHILAIFRAVLAQTLYNLPYAEQQEWWPPATPPTGTLALFSH